MVPVAFVIAPALRIVVPMPMAPVRSRIRRTLPHAGCPDITASVDSPVSINPDKAFAWRWWTPLVAQRRWGPADNDADLPNSRNGECGERSCCKCHGQKLRLPICSSEQGSLLSDFSEIGCGAATSRCPPSPLVARHRPTPDNKVVRRGTFDSTRLSGGRRRGRRHDDRRDLRGPNGLHASASLAGNGRSEDGSNKLPHTADAAKRQAAKHSGHRHFPNSLRSRQSRRQA